MSAPNTTSGHTASASKHASFPSEKAGTVTDLDQERRRRRRGHERHYSSDQGWLGPSIPTTARGFWAYSDGTNYPRGVYRLQGNPHDVSDADTDQAGEDSEKKSSAEWEKLAPLPYVQEVVLRRAASGKITVREFRLSADPEGAFSTLVTRDDIKNGMWMEYLDMPAAALDDTVVRITGTAIMLLAAEVRRVEAVPDWTDQGLQLPPSDVGPYGYGDRCGSEEHAREIWGRVGRILASPGNAHAAMYSGIALAGVFCKPFKLDSFICHAAGDSSQGKTSSLKIAGALFGDPENTIGNWSQAPVAAFESLLKLGCLTAFRDELARLGRKAPKDVEQMIMDIAEGAQRGRGRRDGGTKEHAKKFRGVLMSNGNHSLLDMATEQAGLNVRVLELPTPFTADAETSDQLKALADQAYGWPLHWLREHISLEQAWAHITQARRDLGVDSSEGTEIRIGKNIALGIAGAAMLETLTGVAGIRAAVLEVGRGLFVRQVEEMRESSMRQGDKLLAVIAEAYASQPAMFPPRSIYTSPTAEMQRESLRDVHAITYTEGGEQRIAVFCDKLKALAARANILSPRTALRELRADGRLVIENAHGRQHGLTKREWLGEQIGQVSCYTFRRIDGGGPEDFRAEPVAATADLPLPPMPAAHTVTQPSASENSESASTVSVPAEKSDIDTEDANSSPEHDVASEVLFDCPSPPIPPEPSPSPPVTRAAQAAGALWIVWDGLVHQLHTGTWLSVADSGQGSLADLVATAHAQSATGDVTVVIDPGMQAPLGLEPSPWPRNRGSLWERQSRKADRAAAERHRRVWQPLVDAGWHQPGNPGTPPVVMPTTTLAHPDHNGTTHVLVAGWLTAGTFPYSTHDPECPEALTLAQRLHRFAEVTGLRLGVSEARTALDSLRDALAAGRVRRRPKFLADTSQWPLLQQCNSWQRNLTCEEQGAKWVHGFDAVRNYLPAYAEALCAADDLRHIRRPEFDADMAGMWLITVPHWPHPLVPAPVPDQPAGRQVWVGTAVVRLYHQVDIEPEIREAWIAPGTHYAAFRDFVSLIKTAFAQLETGPLDPDGKPLDPDERAVYDAVKGLYRALHGKFADPHQRSIARPDWGLAVRDAAWTGILRKIYIVAGLLPLGKTQSRTVDPRYPIKVAVDEVLYTSTRSDPRAPEGITVGTALGQFRAKTVVPLARWLEEQQP